MVEVRGLEGDGSKAGEIFALIGGIISLLAGIGVFGWVLYDLYKVGFVNGDPSEKINFLKKIGLGLYLSVIGIWLIVAAISINKSTKIRQGSMVSIILGFLSLNPISILGGIIGLMSLRKDSGAVVGKIKEQMTEKKQEVFSGQGGIKVITNSSDDSNNF